MIDRFDRDRDRCLAVSLFVQFQIWAWSSLSSSFFLSVRWFLRAMGVPYLVLASIVLRRELVHRYCRKVLPVP